MSTDSEAIEPSHGGHAAVRTLPRHVRRALSKAFTGKRRVQMRRGRVVAIATSAAQGRLLDSGTEKLTVQERTLTLLH